MVKTLLYLFLFIFFIIQGTILPYFLLDVGQGTLHIMPQLVLNGLVFLSLYISVQEVFLVAFLFGFLQDLIYGPALGISSFSTLFIVYLTTYTLKFFKPYPWIVLLISALAHFVYLFLIYGWYRVFGFTNIDILFCFIRQVLPSVLFNTLLCYPIFFVVDRLYQQKKVDPIIFQ